jgi:hypothetical protein
MPTFLNYPFDPELFNLRWSQEADPTKTAIVDSGAVVADATIADLISTGGDFYTLPIYDILGGTPDNYDGKTDITIDEPSAKSQSGIVFGRAHGWTEKQFVRDYNSGADPMSQIISQVAKYWRKNDQKIVLALLNACFTAGASDEEFAKHVIDLSSASATVTDDNRMGPTTVGDAAQKAVGDNKDIFSLAFMHSAVAQRLANLNVLDFLKYTDANGVQRPLNIGTINGLTVIVDDGVPHTEGSSEKAASYTTYLIGAGAIRTANAPVTMPSEVSRDPAKNGGQNTLYTRIRKTFHVNGFSYTKPSDYAGSPTDAQLTDAANWKLIANAKTLPLAKIVTN